MLLHWPSFRTRRVECCSGDARTLHETHEFTCYVVPYIILMRCFDTSTSTAVCNRIIPVCAERQIFEVGSRWENVCKRFHFLRMFVVRGTPTLHFFYTFFSHGCLSYTQVYDCGKKRKKHPYLFSVYLWHPPHNPPAGISLDSTAVLGAQATDCEAGCSRTYSEI